MISVLVPDEAASYLGAILMAFNREIFGSFLDEADELVRSGQSASAVLIAGTVLEYFERSPVAGLLLPEHRSEIAAWRQLRNRVAHGSAGVIDAQQARQLIDDVRQILATRHVPGKTAPDRPPSAVASAHFVKGKYAYVPTSSDEFIARKRAELALEDRV